MFNNGLLSWIFPKREPTSPVIWHAGTVAIQTEQPPRPDAPSTERVAVMHPDPPMNELKLRGGGAGDLCCGLCAGLLCFECCEECC